MNFFFVLNFWWNFFLEGYISGNVSDRSLYIILLPPVSFLGFFNSSGVGVSGKDIDNPERWGDNPGKFFDKPTFDVQCLKSLDIDRSTMAHKEYKNELKQFEDHKQFYVDHADKLNKYLYNDDFYWMISWNDWIPILLFDCKL